MEENKDVTTGSARPFAPGEALHGDMFKRLVDGVKDYAIFVLDPEGRVVTWNAGAEVMFGYQPEEIIGFPLSRFYPPEAIPIDWSERELEFARKEGRFEDEAWLVRKDGSRFWANVVITAVRDEQDRLLGFSMITRDLTERRRFEEMLRSVVDHVIDGIITIDAQGTVESFNPAAEKLFGYQAEEVIGQNVKVLMPEPYHGQHDDYLRNYLKTGQAKIIGSGREVVGQRKDGSTFPMELAVSEFTLGPRRFFTGIVRDITERKLLEQQLRQRLQELAEAEERMRSVVNHVVDGIISIDEHGTVLTYNPAAERIFGYTASEVVGQNVKILMPEPFKGQHDDYISNYLHTGQAKIIGIGREVVGQRTDGSMFPMELAISVFRLGDRRYFTGIVRDITERKHMEQELRQRLEDLADADRQKNEFLAMLAHELRNPLAPMRNALHLMKMPKVPLEMLTQARDMMERQLHHMVRLVDDLLDISRIIRGKIDLRREPVDLAEAVARAIETAQPAIDAQGHELVISLPKQPVRIEGDLVRLAQVIANLLTNAAKYTEKAGVISLAIEQEGQMALVQVRDTGLGIPSELLPRIFDLFVQGDRSLARSQGGLGIGLTLVKRLVEMHGGSVKATSRGPDQGSEFTITLPMLPDVPHQGGASAPSAETELGEALRKRVLVVDDNVDAAESIAMFLRLCGYEVQCVYDGLSVLNAAQTYQPDVVVLDIGLPGMSGYDVARQLRQQAEFRRTPLVAVTGYGQEDDRRRSYDAGFNHHLTKPVDPNALQAFVAHPASFR